MRSLTSSAGSRISSLSLREYFGPDANYGGSENAKRQRLSRCTMLKYAVEHVLCRFE